MKFMLRRLFACFSPQANPDITLPPPRQAMPTVKFDPACVTDLVKAELKNSIKLIKKIDQSHFGNVYAVALSSIASGYDASILFNALVELQIDGVSKQRARQITRFLHSRIKAVIERERLGALGVKYSIWVYSGAPCMEGSLTPTCSDISQDSAHASANGKKYETQKGLIVDGKQTWPGMELECKCVSKAVIPGFED